MQLSTGPWSYNRFNAFEQTLTEGAKPDYLDFDKDGDKKEPMKKALKEKGKKEVKEDSMPPWLKDKKDDKKESCDDCKKAGKKDCKCDDDKKDDKKPAFLQKEAIINSLMADGLANNPVSAEIIAEHMSEAWAQAILDESE
jgi:hypothetical protein